jgi:hypothetical protein
MSAATRARMSATQKELAKSFDPNGRPWTAAEDELVRALPPAEAAAQTGRTAGSVYGRRRRLKLPRAGAWTAEEDRLVRTLPAQEVARQTGRTLGSVHNRRWQLKQEVELDGGNGGLVSGADAPDLALVRAINDGQLDTTFDFDGILTTDFGGADKLYGLALDGTRLVAVGSAGTSDDPGDFVVRRHLV